MVGINSHMERSLQEKTMDLEKFWFSDYLKASPAEMEDGDARVTAFFRVIRRTESLRQHFIPSHSDDAQLVEQVTYGAEFIFSMQRPVDWLKETKSSAEELIYDAALVYFDDACRRNWNLRVKPPAELENLSCTIFSSLRETAEHAKKDSFKLSCKWLSDAIQISEEDGQTLKWRPIDILMRQSGEIRFSSEKLEDDKLEIRRNWQWVSNESRNLLNHRLIQRIAPFEENLIHFRHVLEPLRQYVEENLVESTRESMKLLADVTDWVKRRSNEINTVHSLLNDNNLPVFDLADIEGRVLLRREKQVKVFILRIDYEEDLLIDYIRKLTGSNASQVFKRPVFPVIFSGPEMFTTIDDALREFAEEARLFSNLNQCYLIGLVPASSHLGDGAIKSFLCPAVNRKRNYQNLMVNENELLAGSCECKLRGIKKLGADLDVLS